MTNYLNQYMQAKRPIVYINNYDYKEVDNFILEGTNSMKDMLIYEYRAVGEMHFANKEILNEVDLLSFLKSRSSEGVENKVILVLKDIDKELEHPKVIAMLKKIAETNMYYAYYHCMVVIVSLLPQPPKEIENYVTLVNLPKMSEEEIKQYIVQLAQEKHIKIVEEDLGEIVLALKGLSKLYITQIINMMNSISKSNIHKVIREKGQIIKKSGILELIDFKENASDIGGLYFLKEWLANKAEVFRRLDEARKYGVDTPKGLLLVGMPGCGKSLTAKAASRMFNVPLLRLDIGRLLGKYVGESEHNLRKALEMAEEISPCILWIDEIEKAFAGVNQSGGASDITKRLFGHFLTWLQEKENTVFVVATANDITSFPPEFMRKGRFDEIFYVDFPNTEERKEIIKIHLEKRGQWNNKIDSELLAKKTKGYSGADLEEVVKYAVEANFLKSLKTKENAVVTTEMLKEAIDEIDSMSSILREKVKALKKAFTTFKLKPASLAEGQKVGDKIKKSNTEEKDMIWVRGGKYTPSFFKEERKVDDLYVGKYVVTEDDWGEVMGTSHKGRRPKVDVTWFDILTYCNRLSKKHGLQPAYKIENNELVKIIHSDGTETVPNEADFSQVEGYRLPTNLEWEWFARGGDPALQDGTFDLKCAGSDDPNVTGWYKDNSGDKLHDVGLKKPNALNLYDCYGNVREFVYDTCSDGFLREDKAYIYENSKENISRGGDYRESMINNGGVDVVVARITSSLLSNIYRCEGFRIVRTA